MSLWKSSRQETRAKFEKSHSRAAGGDRNGGCIDVAIEVSSHAAVNDAVRTLRGPLRREYTSARGRLSGLRSQSDKRVPSSRACQWEPHVYRNLQQACYACFMVLPTRFVPIGKLCALRQPLSSKASGQLLGLATRARALAIASLQRRHSRSGPCCLGMGTARIASPEPAPSGTPAGPVERTISRTRPAASRQYAPASPCLRMPPMLPTAQGYPWPRAVAVIHRLQV